MFQVVEQTMPCPNGLNRLSYHSHSELTQNGSFAQLDQWDPIAKHPRWDSKVHQLTPSYRSPCQPKLEVVQFGTETRQTTYSEFCLFTRHSNSVTTQDGSFVQLAQIASYSHAVLFDKTVNKANNAPEDKKISCTEPSCFSFFDNG